jgi:hypothetical protein
MQGDAELPLEHSCGADVVGMVVRDYERVDGADVATVGGEPLGRRGAADTGIEQKPHTARLDVDTVAVAPRLERYDPHAAISAYLHGNSVTRRPFVRKAIFAVAYFDAIMIRTTESKIVEPS